MNTIEALERFVEALDAEGDFDIALREHGSVLRQSTVGVEYEEYLEARRVLITFLNRALADNDIFCELEF